MANIAGRILGKIRKLFSRQPKKTPTNRKIVGHRGIAAGNLKERQRKQEAGEQPFTLEEIGKWQTYTGDEVEDFLNGLAPLFVHSSNVESFTYFPGEEKMLVTFLKGRHRRYMVSPISEQEAMEFAKAPSKGAAYYDIVRVRGPGNSKKSKKNVQRL